MAKIGPRELRLRELAARRVSKPAKTVTPGAPRPFRGSSKPKKAKPRVRAKKRHSQTPAVKVVPPSPRQGYSGSNPPSATAGPVTTPKIGRPPTGFDRTAYQRLYCSLWRRNGKRPSPTWTEEDRQSLKRLKA